MITMQELLPHIAPLEAGERHRVDRPERPWSVVMAHAFAREEEARRSPHARLLHLAWVSTTYAAGPQAVFGSEPIVLGPGEDLEAARVRFSLVRTGELVEAHPAGTVGLIEGPLPPLESISEEMAGAVLEALGRARAAGATLLGAMPHPSPALFETWLSAGERSPWVQSSGLTWCYLHLGTTVLRLEAYEIAPEHHERVVAIAADQFQKGFAWSPSEPHPAPEPLSTHA